MQNRQSNNSSQTNNVTTEKNSDIIIKFYVNGDDEKSNKMDQQRLWQINNYHKQQARTGASNLPGFCISQNSQAYAVNVIWHLSNESAAGVGDFCLRN